MNLIDTYLNSNAYNKQIVKNIIDQIVSRNKPTPIIPSTDFEEGFIMGDVREGFIIGDVREGFIMTDPQRVRGQRANLIYHN